MKITNAEKLAKNTEFMERAIGAECSRRIYCAGCPFLDKTNACVFNRMTYRNWLKSEVEEDIKDEISG